MNNNRTSPDDDPRVADAGTIAGRAPAPVVPKPGPDDEPTGSPGATIDRDQAKERDRKTAK